MTIAPPTAAWKFLTNHAQVLLRIAADPDVRLRDVAVQVGVTERAVQKIVSQLAESGYLMVSPRGRRNSYVINKEAPLDPPQAGATVRKLITTFGLEAKK